MSDTSYTIELTEEELLVVKKALDQFYNIGLGHFKSILISYKWKNVEAIVSDLLELATTQLTRLPKSILWGINDPNVHPDCRLADKLSSKIKKMIGTHG